MLINVELSCRWLCPHRVPTSSPKCSTTTSSAAPCRERVSQGHVHLQETLADDLLRAMLAHPHVRARARQHRKPDVYPDCEAVGVEVFGVKPS